jgi:transcriptional regulator with XRE-family HTH domain
MMRAIATEHWQQFGDVVRSLRESHGWSLRRCAREIPISHSYQCNIELGQVAPPSDQLIVRMAEIFEVSPRYLLIRAGRLPPVTLSLFWEHPAVPPILSTIPGMSLEDAQVFCRQVVAALHITDISPSSSEGY